MELSKILLVKRRPFILRQQMSFLCSDNFKASHRKSGCKKLYVILFKFHIKVDPMALAQLRNQIYFQ